MDPAYAARPPPPRARGKRGMSGVACHAMAVHSKHPASAPPAPPVREKTGHLMLRGWCIFVMFMASSGTAWVHAFGELTAAVITIAGGVLSVILWFVIRPPMH